MFIYSDEMIEFLKNIAFGKSTKETTELFNKKFNLQKTIIQISSLMKRKGIKTGRTGHFEKGAIPFNKGMKGQQKSNVTSFKKGCIPHNYVPIGSERVNSDGYVDIKISENKWKQKHRIIWEEVNGPIPRNSCLIFADSNKLNVSLGNLILVTRRELFKMNQEKLIKDRKELTEVGHTVAKLKIKVQDITKKK